MLCDYGVGLFALSALPWYPGSVGAVRTAILLAGMWFADRVHHILCRFLQLSGIG
jgi:hypothetical protein